MNRTFFEELPARKVAGPVVAAKKEGGQGGGAQGGEASAKKIRQAVYDIRYRARREDIELQAAYNQYMSNTSMTAPEKAEVKKKLFGESFLGNYIQSKKLEEATKGEGADKKYKVRVTDKATGRTYVRFATREKINQLRNNPAIASVEMTDYGLAYEGEKKGGEEPKGEKKEDKKDKKDMKESLILAIKEAKEKSKKKKLDPVGKEDGDIDNDGDEDETDSYLLNRRKKRTQAINANESCGGSHSKKKKKKGYTAKESAEFYDWRSEFFSEMNDQIDPETEKKVVEKAVNNKITINPKLGESKSDPCWKGYKQVGMKMKGGKKVPNCVSVSEEKEKCSKCGGEGCKHCDNKGYHTEAVAPHTKVYYDPKMRQLVPRPGGVPVPRASGGPALPGEPGRPGSGKKGGRPLLPGEKPFSRLAKKKATTQMAGYEPEGETIEERDEWFHGLKDRIKGGFDAYNRSRGVPSSGQTGGGSRPSITVRQTKSAEKTTPYSKTDSGQLTDFGAGGGKEKMRRTGMKAHEVEQLGRANRGIRLPQIDDHSKYHKNSFEPEGESIDEIGPAVAIPLVAAGAYGIHKLGQHLKKKGDEALDKARKGTTLKGNAFGGDLRMKGTR
jgi:hypothetical protein